MIDFRRAQALIRASVEPVDSERIALFEAGRRIISEDICAPIDLPPYPIAIRAGYSMLEINDNTDEQGGDHAPDTDKIHTVRVPVFPGDPIPNPDIEDSEPIVSSWSQVTDSDTTLELTGEHIVTAGAVHREGSTVIQGGHLLGPSDIALLADLGIRRVGVHRAPRVAILTIGNDLVKIDDVIPAGCRFDSAGALINDTIVQCSGIPVQLGPIPENFEDMEFAVSKGLEEDALIIAAHQGFGRGAGLLQVLSKHNMEAVFSGVRIWPGGTIVLGHIKEIPVLVLPLAVGELLTAAELMMVPFIRRLSGRKRSIRRGISGVLRADLSSPYRDKCIVWGVRMSGEFRPYDVTLVDQWPGATRYRTPDLYGLCLSEQGEDLREGDDVEVLPLISRVI